MKKSLQEMGMKVLRYGYEIMWYGNGSYLSELAGLLVTGLNMQTCSKER